MKRKKRHLKQWVKNTIYILIILILLILSSILIYKHIQNKFNECDKEKGYYCTWYDLHSLKK